MYFSKKLVFRFAITLCGLVMLLPVVALAETRLDGQAASVAGTQPGDWPMYSYDPQRTSYNPYETTLSAANIGQIGQLWQSSIGIGASGNPAYSAPVVANGKVFVGTQTDVTVYSLLP